MRDKERIKKILSKIEKLWNKYPDQRFGQLLENYVFVRGNRGDITSCRLFYQEDDETELNINNNIKEDEKKKTK